LLPRQFEVYVCRDWQSVVFAIREMVVRGAPAIGAAAAFGMALAACGSTGSTMAGLQAELSAAAAGLLASRPTAVNLAWGVQRMTDAACAGVTSPAELCDRLIAEAQAYADEEVQASHHMAEFGAPFIADGDTIIHHCNTGSLATVDWGTALGVIHLAHQQGKRIHVLVDETRPRLQGARLTAWELSQYGIPYEIISDGAAGHFLHTGQVQKVFFGADRVAANGDVANKVGTYMLALAAHSNGVPVYPVFPTTTVDMSLAHGDLIPIEERGEEEVLEIEIKGQRVVPTGARARNPAFDVTPHELVTALVTEKGIAVPPFDQNLARLVRANPYSLRQQ
jgi:methylthioribose-1-phosphate isomerase